MHPFTKNEVVVDLASRRPRARHVAGPVVSRLEEHCAKPTTFHLPHEGPDVRGAEKAMPLLVEAFDDLIGMGVNAVEAGR